MSEFNSGDWEGQMLKQDYESLVNSIRQNMDPKSNTVLLIDDERGIRMKVARDVRKFDSTLVIHDAANGKDGLKKLAWIRAKYKKDPLLIVLDLNMPVMDGWEVIEHLKEEYVSQGKQAGVPIVVLSSTSGEKGRMPFSKKSVHDGKSGYTPMVCIAKEACVDKTRYDGTESKGLLAWLEYFMHKS